MNIAIIPARKNSQRINNKNIKIFDGKPIIYWSIKTAIQSKLFKEVFVSTDSKKIAQLAIKYGAKALYPRPSKLSDGYTTIIDVIKFEMKNLENKNFKFDNVCCIFPATPFLRAKYLSEGLRLLKKSKLKVEEMKGATITITNIGSVGGTYATPIINHPEVAIIGMYKMIKKPLYVEKTGKFKTASMMNYTVTADHRLIDGAVAANFLKSLFSKLENPAELMIGMM